MLVHWLAVYRRRNMLVIVFAGHGERVDIVMAPLTDCRLMQVYSFG
jgi:hypothetical protein